MDCWIRLSLAPPELQLMHELAICYSLLSSQARCLRACLFASNTSIRHECAKGLGGHTGKLNYTKSAMHLKKMQINSCYDCTILCINIGASIAFDPLHQAQNLGRIIGEQNNDEESSQPHRQARGQPGKDASHDAGDEPGKAWRCTRTHVSAGAKIRKGYKPNRGEPIAADFPNSSSACCILF